MVWLLLCFRWLEPADRITGSKYGLQSDPPCDGKYYRFSVKSEINEKQPRGMMPSGITIVAKQPLNAVFQFER